MWKRQITIQAHDNLLEENGNERKGMRETRMAIGTPGHLERDHQEVKTLKRVSNSLARFGSTIHASTIFIRTGLAPCHTGIRFLDLSTFLPIFSNFKARKAKMKQRTSVQVPSNRDSLHEMLADIQEPTRTRHPPQGSQREHLPAGTWPRSRWYYA
jgi:hypothetical protein